MRLTFLISFATWLVFCAPAGAQPEGFPADPPGYQDLIAEAIREFDARNYEEARSLFARAHDLFPNARTHRGLGFVEFELRNYSSSIQQLEAALASDVKPLDERLRQDTRHILARARGFVGHLRLKAKPDPSLVLVDDAVADLADGEALVLRIGDHVVELRAEGYLPERRRLSLEAGEQRTLRVIFSRPVYPAGPMRASARATAHREDQGPGRQWYKSPWLWAAVGVVLAAAAVGTGVALAADTSRQGAELPPKRLETP